MPKIYGTPEWEEVLERVRKNRTITIDLLGLHIGDPGASELSIALKQNYTVTALNLASFLGNFRIGDMGAKDLASAIRDHPTLIYLNLEYNEIGEVGAEALASALQFNTKLIYLNLGTNKFGAYGAKCLSLALKENPNLTFLDLGNNDIRNEGFKSLMFSLENHQSLQTLHLAHNKVDDEGAKILASVLHTNRSFTSIELPSNYISNDGGAMIKQALESNFCVTGLNLSYNMLDAVWKEEITQLTLRNSLAVEERKLLFLYKLIILARDGEDQSSQSYWRKLPRDIRLHIIGKIKLKSEESIGKSSKQIIACTKFLMEQIERVNAQIKGKIKIRIKEQKKKHISERYVWKPVPSDHTVFAW